jgi:hypothetical protein
VVAARISAKDSLDGVLLGGDGLGLCDGGHWVRSSWRRFFGVCRCSLCKRNHNSV